MSKRQYFAFIMFFLLVSVSFQNCGKTGFKASESTLLFSVCKMNPAKPSPFVSGKVLLNKTVFSAQQKLSDSALKVSLIVDVSCVLAQEEPLMFFEEEIKISKMQESFPRLSMSVNLASHPEMAEIEEEMAKSECLLGLAENFSVKRSLTLTPDPVDDPQAVGQAHIDLLEYPRSRGLQNTITSEVIVAVVDTGIDYNHPDLTNRMWTDTDGSHGYDFVNQSSDAMDINGHGTHVAGIIAAAEDNGIGVSGLTGNYVKLMAIKALEGTQGSSQAVHNGVMHAISKGAKVINMSIESETTGTNPLIESALEQAVQAGIVVTVAAGNNGLELDSGNIYAPAYLGNQLNGVVTVASIDTSTLSLSSFSNFSTSQVEIGAPGNERNSNLSTGGILSTTIDDNYARIKGTSQAAPMVAAAAAMVIGFISDENIPYSAGGIENFVKSEGTGFTLDLRSYIDDGRILHMGHLAENLADYVLNNPNPDFTATGQSCFIN